MILLGISGGPDSMYLLHKISKKTKDIIVATVNYNIRKDSSKDVKIVEDYCIKNNIRFFIHKVAENICFTGNFENWARKIRFDFFKEIYTKFNCKMLCLAHQKDDFLESALMQKQSKRKPLFYGIKEKNIVNGMKIYRPLLFMKYKEEIIKELDDLGIAYAIDYTNELPIYTRNKIRLETLAKLTQNEKENLFEKIQKENKKLQVLLIKINDEYKLWKHEKFEQDVFKKLKNKQHLIYKMINKNFKSINLSSTKIKSIIDFILGDKRTNKYLLKDNTFLVKKQGKLLNII